MGVAFADDDAHPSAVELEQRQVPDAGVNERRGAVPNCVRQPDPQLKPLEWFSR